MFQPLVDGVVISKEMINRLFVDTFDGSVIQSAYLEIDGQQAVIGKGEIGIRETFIAIWPIKNNMAYAGFMSTIPWDDGTSNLVNTIHVERRDIWDE
ncbi:MAG: hypothetical protein U9N48_04980 [Euryarchaeota archaeon]|nr:hypothetical protein [Euryarchaeota archaeon]